jgi:hypothetical protein
MRQACALFHKTLSNKALEKLARETGFVRRQRLVTAAGAFWAFIVALGGQSTEFISDVLRTLNARECWTLRYKPFWDRLARRSFVAFMRELFGRLCREMSLRILEREAHGVAIQFSAIFVDDGSSFGVADGLRKVFPGRFTKFKPAAVELHAHMDLLADNLSRVTLAADKEAERQFLPAANSLPRGSLSLRDRGYIDLGYFEDLADAEAYLICRSHNAINPTVVRVCRGMSRKAARRWEGKRLQQVRKQMPRRDLELRVSWPRPSGGALELRLILRYQKPKRHKNTASPPSWTWLLTNLPPSVSPWAVGQLYRLRWQIELVFKDWKSYSNLHAFQSEQPYIVEGFIWASLCAAFLKRAVAHLAQLLTRRPISTRLAAMAGPHIVSWLATWARSGFRPKRLQALLVFMLNNARPTHPERQPRAPAALLGLRSRTRLPLCLLAPP